MPHTYATSTVHEYKFDGVDFLFTCLRQTKLAKKCNDIIHKEIFIFMLNECQAPKGLKKFFSIYLS